MVNDLALFVLPLVNHFVEERVERFVPSVTQDMMPTDNDFRWHTFRRHRRIVTEATFHAP